MCVVPLNWPWRCLRLGCCAADYACCTMQYLLLSVALARVALAHVEDSPKGIAANVQAALEDSIERVRELFASKTELQVSIRALREGSVF